MHQKHLIQMNNVKSGGILVLQMEMGALGLILQLAPASYHKLVQFTKPLQDYFVIWLISVQQNLYLA